MTDTLSIEWQEPEQHAQWAVWNTACGRYRIVLSDDAYTPYRLQVTKRSRALNERQWVALNPQDTWIDAAMAVNEFHCKQHGVVLV